MIPVKNETLKAEGYQPLIFIAEDEPTNLRVLYNMLKKGNFRMAAAGNGNLALTAISKAQPDLILLDVMMPGLDGFEVCERLQKDPATKDIPVIFLTARIDEEDVIRGFNVGAVDYVTKPFNRAELLSRIKTHLELKFARESLKELNATKDRFFSVLAHDLRNPLQVLSLSVEFLHKKYNLCSEDKKKEYIQKLYSGTQLLAALLENLLEWSMSQRGVIKCRPEKLDIGELVDGSIDLTRESAEKKGIKIISRIVNETYAFADRNMIRVVIRNLLSNAVKFTNTGGKVKISASESDNFIEITVADTGIGINLEDIPGLFQIDKQITTAGTHMEKGSGLGLILCKEFVEKNKGTISVISAPGKGASFKFTLSRRALV